MTKKALAPEHLRFAVLAADTVLFSIRNGELVARTIRVNRSPAYIDAKGFPGGLLDPSETAEQCVHRLIGERGHILNSKVYTEQLYTFSELERDPRGRVVSVAYLSLVPWENLSEVEKTGSHESRWEPIKALKQLAYDHDEMLSVALSRLRSRITYTTLISKLMPQEFTLTELEKAYASILKTDLDKRNFRKKILKLKILKPLPHKKKGGAFRPAKLYSFRSTIVTEIAVL
jgi:8-oxo-dGTP diphosphatase